MHSSESTALPEVTDIAIIGSGFAGLGMAIQLRRRGQTDFLLLEKAETVGGVWRDNRYPGCACDVPSHLYSYSFAPNPDWSRAYSQQPEIERYLQNCANRYQVIPHIRFGRHLVKAEYSEDAGFWILSVADSNELAAYMNRRGLKSGDRLDTQMSGFPRLQTVHARVLISGMGGLSTPSMPEIEGLNTFRGQMFHSQDWPHLNAHEHGRIAVIGTGASAIQLVPKLQKTASKLYLYQRTPPWILPKHDRPVSRLERWLFKHVPFTQRLIRAAFFWQAEATVIGFLGARFATRIFQRFAAEYLAKQVRDPVLRRELTPDYQLGCKRVLISSDYYPALQKENVELVTSSIERITEKGIVDCNGVERLVDVIVMSTGFQATAFMPPGTIIGAGRQELSGRWKNGAEAYKGCTIAGFPNFFMLVGPNVTLGHNSMVYMIEAQIAYVMGALDQMSKHGLAAVDIASSVLSQYNLELQQNLQNTIWAVGGCRSWYMDRNGKNVTLWPGSSWRFRRKTRHFDIENYLTSPIRGNADARRMQ